jgi:hypothetical protein
MTPEQMWAAPAAAPVQPRPVSALTGLDEKLLHTYRVAPSWWLGRRLRPDVAGALVGEIKYEAVHQMVRMVGIALWEREQEQIADAIGV